MKSKNQHYHFIYLFGVLLFILTGFIPEKYAPGFKDAKKGIDTLSILPPIVQVAVASDKKTKSIEPDLTQINTRLIDSITK